MTNGKQSGYHIQTQVSAETSSQGQRNPQGPLQAQEPGSNIGLRYKTLTIWRITNRGCPDIVKVNVEFITYYGNAG